jgi:hypothetical protein
VTARRLIGPALGPCLVALAGTPVSAQVAGTTTATPTATAAATATGSSGTGLFDLTPGVLLAVPADAYAGVYSGGVTLTLVAGP